MHSPLPHGLQQRLQRASPSSKLCEVNGPVDPELTGLLLEATRASSYIAASSQLSQQTSSLKAANWTVRRREVSDADALGGCDVVVATMDGKTAAHRHSLQLELPRVLALARQRGRSMVVAYGHKGRGDACARPERFWAVDGRKWETCWYNRWIELVNRQDLLRPRCEIVGSRRFCHAEINRRSACASRLPLTNARCGVLASEVRFVPGSTTWRGENHLAYRVASSFRYYSIATCNNGNEHIAPSGSSTLCLIFKDRSSESWIGLLTSSDGGRSFVGNPELVMPAADVRQPERHLPAFTHNYAVLRHPNGTHILVGGRHRSVRRGVGGDSDHGVWMATGGSWRFSEWVPTSLHPVYIGRGSFAPVAAPNETQWHNVRKLIDGSHAGCIERRELRQFPQLAGPGVCEFDGRLSLAYLNNTFYLFARANLGRRNGRFVQMATSRDMVSWSAFVPIKIDRLQPHQAEIYFFSAMASPVHHGTLLALYPLVHHSKACIGLSLSVDGQTWSPVTPLTQCKAHGERSEDHPVAGAALMRTEAHPDSGRRRQRIVFFVQERVPGISYDLATPKALAKLHEFLEYKVGGARIVRYSVPCELLAAWTARELAGLAAKGVAGAALAAERRDLYVCPPEIVSGRAGATWQTTCLT